LDVWLGIDDASVSRGARQLCSLAAMAGGSFAKGTEVLWRLGQLRVSDEQLRTLAEVEGRHVKDALEEGRVGPDWTAASCRTPDGVSRIMVGADGVMVPVITAAEKANLLHKVMVPTQLSPFGQSVTERIDARSLSLLSLAAVCKGPFTPPASFIL